MNVSRPNTAHASDPAGRGATRGRRHRTHGAHPELFDLPVVFVSGYGRDETIARVFEAGVVDYIVKPFSPGWWRGSARRTPARGSRAVPAPRPGRQLRAPPGGAGRPPRALSRTEYEILRILSVDAGRMVSAEALLCGHSVSASTISRIHKRLDGTLTAFAERERWLLSPARPS